MAIVALWLIFTIPLVWIAPTSGLWFRIRVALAGCDSRYSFRHWINDKKCLVRRNTELGGIMTIAGWVLFTGLASSLAYDAISSDIVTIQYLTPAKREDIQMFRNDIEINLTAVGQIQCNQIVRSKVFLSSEDGHMMNLTDEYFNKPSCVDTSKGPLLRIFCKGCIVENDRYFFMWEFQDQLNARQVASAVGFEINASATAIMPLKSILAAIIPGGYNRKPASAVTLRGSDWNVISLNVVPRIFKSKGDKKLMQIMFHMFTSGSHVVNIKEMQAAFAKNQGVKVALQLNVLSQYLVETTHRSYIGVVKFLGYLGGLYILCRFLFLIIMFQDFVRSGQSSTEGTSSRGNNGENKVARSRFFVRQYRKPIWIHEPQALPPVPELPDFVSYSNDESERHAYLHTVNEYLQRMYVYSTRLRRDYLATLTVLQKVVWSFGLPRT